EPVELLVARLRSRQQDVAQLGAELGRLEAQRTERSVLPSREQVAQALAGLAPRLLEMDREAGPLLRRLVGPIRAVPHQQFGSDHVVLRAKFELRLVALLPEQLLARLKGARDDALVAPLWVVALSVDLFERSAGPRHYARAL